MTLKNTNGEVHLVSEQCCTPSLVEVEIRLQKTVAKNWTREVDTDISKIYGEEMGTFVPLFECMKYILYRHRQGLKTETHCAKEVEIPERSFLTNNGVFCQWCS